MFEFISLEKIVEYCVNTGISIDLSLLNPYEQSVLYIVGNLFFILVWAILLSIAYKIILKVLNFLL